MAIRELGFETGITLPSVRNPAELHGWLVNTIHSPSPTYRDRKLVLTYQQRLERTVALYEQGVVDLVKSGAPDEDVEGYLTNIALRQLRQTRSTT